MRWAPGSFLWLVRHDLRLAWRGVAGLVGSMRPATVAALVVVGLATMHVLAWPLVEILDPYLHARGASIASLAAILGATFTWMLAQGIFGLTRALYHRADLDLLLGSPLSATRVIAAKVVSIAAGSFGSIAILALPVAHMGALFDGPHWLGIYVLLVAFALLSTAIGLALVVGLFFAVGPRRARLMAHLLAAGTAGAFVLGTQVVAMLPAAWRDSITDQIDASFLEQATGLAAILWIPVIVAQGNIVASTILLMLAGLGFSLAMVGAAGRFAAASLASAGSDADAAPSGRTRFRSFRSGLGTCLRAKEWRLLLRDPSFFAQLALQVVYTIPIAVVLIRSETLSLALSIGPTIVMIAAQVSGSIAWITVSGEDAPELLASAPVTRGAVDLAKLTAVAGPVLMLLAVPVIGLGLVSSPLAAFIVFLIAAMAATSTALLNFWHPMPGNRRGMLRRHSQSKMIGMIEHGLAMLWAFAVVFALMGTSVVLAPLGLVLVILSLVRRVGHRRSDPAADVRVPGQPLTEAA
ncbi:MAG: hypothetical protein R3D57_03815 [Hyphomicrobiaceae bacterium]